MNTTTNNNSLGEQQYYQGIEVESAVEEENNDEDNNSVEDSVNINWGFSYHSISGPNNYKETDILIDTGSTVSVFNNDQLLTNVRKLNRS